MDELACLSSEPGSAEAFAGVNSYFAGAFFTLAPSTEVFTRLLRELHEGSHYVYGE
eukprot:CAMPEP_0118980648 /NCGR_PEP_ID=MMETSP1173-20130426/28794_1 /TAXON_ID=1034831 /ORGANISM="Rhizochromulina marina cf, Strain CCMP1243" /LENGTH=55 /DNA_ID=CAMNT_0006931007 /DNA_START=6 /DNA_END=170 /DNA_ORIENTATION=-